MTQLRVLLSRHQTTAWLVLVAVMFCLPLFAGLGRTDLQNDEAIYSFAADDIVRHGGWLDPRSSPTPEILFVEKPPLKFWIVALPIRAGLLPANEFGLRFWDAVFGSAVFLYTFTIGRRLAGPLCGIVALFVLYSYEPLLFDHGLRSNNMEASLVLAYAGGAYHYLRWSEAASRGERIRHAAAVGAYFFLGFMTKFVAVLFLPLVLGATSLVFGSLRLQIRRDWRLWLAVAAADLALILPWFVYKYFTLSPGILSVMFGTHVVQRFTSSLDSAHLHSWTYYWAEIFRQTNGIDIFKGIVGGSWTFACAAAGAALILVRTVRQRRVDGALLAIWFVLPIALMSFFTSKLGHYLYPFLPPFAIAAGYLPAWIMRPNRAASVAPDSAAATVASRRVRAGRLALLAASAACVTLAVLTFIHGPLQLELGGMRILTNRTPLRPGIGAVVLGMLGAGGIAALRPATVALLLLMGPLPKYWEFFPRAMAEEHPLRGLRDCMAQVRESERQQGRQAPGLLAVVPAQFEHQFYFYFRDVGWQAESEISDRDLTRMIDEPGQQRPVLVERFRYEQFLNHYAPQPSRPEDPEYMRRVDEAPAVKDWLTHAPPRTRLTDQALMLLPGPYAVCRIPS